MALECSKLFLKLDFDKPKMEGSLAGKYFEDHQKVFGEKNAESVTDTLGNKIFSSNFKYIRQVQILEREEWIRSTEYRREFFKKLGTEIKKNIQLLAEVEYYVRGIPITETKEVLSQLVETCDVIADVLCNIPERFEEMLIHCNDIHQFQMNNTCSIHMLIQVLYSLAANAAVKIHVKSNTAVLVYIFSTLVETCDNKNFIPSIGPYINVTFDNEGTFKVKRGSCMMVCKGADLDSAVETVIRGAWSCNGFLPYALNRILVQENVWDEFNKKLSHKVEQFIWNYPEEYKPDDDTVNVIRNVNNVLNKAKKNGQAFLKMNDMFYKTENNGKLLKPLVLLDEDPYFWEDLTKEALPTPVITLQAFRTNKEALLLLNKVPQEYLSVWCSDISVCNEISMKADVPTVWINNFGVCNPNVEARESIYNRLIQQSFKFVPVEPNKIEPNVLNEDSALKKIAAVYSQWLTLSKEKRISKLLSVAKYLEENATKFYKSPFNMSEECCKDFKSLISSWTCYNDVYAKDIYICMQFKKPLGVVTFQNNTTFYGMLSAIATATLSGNGVLYIASKDYESLMCEILFNLNIPVIEIRNNNKVSNFDLHIISNPCFSFNDFSSFLFAKTKCIWYTYGESFYDGKMVTITS